MTVNADANEPGLDEMGSRRSGNAGGCGTPGSRLRSAISRLNQRVKPWITNRTVNAYALALTSPIILLLSGFPLRPLLVDSGPFCSLHPRSWSERWYGGSRAGPGGDAPGRRSGRLLTFSGPLVLIWSPVRSRGSSSFLLVGGQISWLSGALSRAHTDSRSRLRERTSELEFQKTLLEAQSNASLDGIMVASDERNLIFHNRRLLDLWNLPVRAFDSSLESAVIGDAAGTRRRPGPPRSDRL